MFETYEELLYALEQSGLSQFIPVAEKLKDTHSVAEIVEYINNTLTYQNYTEEIRALFENFSQYEDVASDTASKLVVSDGMTVVIGFVVVLATLLVLTGIFYLFGFIMNKVNSPKTPKKVEKPKAAPVATPAPVAAPVVQSGIPGEVVAAIAAAVSMMAPGGKRYAVKSISRKDTNGRSAWAAAGLADNTRPF